MKTVLVSMRERLSAETISEESLRWLVEHGLELISEILAYRSLNVLTDR